MRCGNQDAQTAAVADVVSHRFSDVDGWADLGGSRLCAACTWAYTEPVFRQQAHLITLEAGAHALSRAEVGALLAKARVPAHWSVTVPLIRGRKHVLDYAQWGQVTVEDIVAPWGQTDAARLLMVQELRAMGFGGDQLRRATPPWVVLSRLGWTRAVTATNLWEQLTPWRKAADTTCLDLALWATTAESR